ncbi:MAG: gluconokinase [Ktedonobacteraceae bacterium]
MTQDAQSHAQIEGQAAQATQTTDPKPPFILSLDIGTSSTRTLLFDATGSTIASVHAQRPYKLTVTDDGEVSVDADALVDVVVQTVGNALRDAGPMAQQIGAVAIDTFWHSLLGVDESNNPITPVITWEDTRPYGAAAELRSQLDAEEIHHRTGAPLHASFWPAKLRWLATNQPDVFKRAAQWISFGEYLHRKFLGKSVCALAMASATGLLNTRDRAWDTDLVKVLGVRSEQLPQLGDTHDGLRGLSSEYASAWPALRNVPWFPAIGDGAAAAVGSGCANSDTWSLTIGTSSAIRVVLPPERAVPSVGLWMYLIDAKRAIMGGALSEGGNMLNWLDTMLKLPALADAEPLIAHLKPDAHGLTILPFISGERSLGWHADARMTITNLQSHTAPADILRAGMEALAYQLGAVYEQLRETLKEGDTLPTPQVVGSGGALLGSPTLQSILADTLGTPIYPSLDHEATARGAAMLALEALGVIPDISKVEPRLTSPTQPDAGRGAVYKKGAERQKKLYQVLLGN